jgi:ribosome biogenesis GTPase
MAKNHKRKIRAEFRKRHEKTARQRHFTRDYHQNTRATDDTVTSQRVTGKGEVTRKRTVMATAAADESTGLAVHLDVDENHCLAGRVLSVHGQTSSVCTDDGTVYRCATRGLLKNLNIEQRQVVAAGDRVRFRPAAGHEGLIERIEPRHGVLSRTSKGRQHVLVSNVDQLLIVASVAEPELKPHLIDRFLVAAEKSAIRPIICINKVDLIAPADIQPLAGVYGQMGYEVILLSATAGFGVDLLRRKTRGRESVVAGQSGVGKSSLLNAIEPGLDLRVATVSEENEKGRHTTSVAQLIPLTQGGYVVDTPGIRQFQLWDLAPEEVAGFYRDIRPYVSQCRFADCTHTHEEFCAVKDAVADGRVDARRYESYCRLYADEEEDGESA